MIPFVWPAAHVAFADCKNANKASESNARPLTLRRQQPAGTTHLLQLFVFVVLTSFAPDIIMSLKEITCSLGSAYSLRFGRRQRNFKQRWRKSTWGATFIVIKSDDTTEVTNHATDQLSCQVSCVHEHEIEQHQRVRE